MTDKEIIAWLTERKKRAREMMENSCNNPSTPLFMLGYYEGRYIAIGDLLNEFREKKD